jgi:hypothetical protein
MSFNIYIVCGLTHVPREQFHAYADFIHALAAHLTSEMGASVRYALRDSDPQLAKKPFAERARLCYLWDKDMVEWADVIVAEGTYPSTGLGIELQIAENKDIPIVICFNDAISYRASPVQYINPEDQACHSLQLGQGYVSLMALGLPSIVRVVPYSLPERARADLLDALRLIERPSRIGETDVN